MRQKNIIHILQVSCFQVDQHSQKISKHTLKSGPMNLLICSFHDLVREIHPLSWPIFIGDLAFLGRCRGPQKSQGSQGSQVARCIPRNPTSIIVGGFITDWKRRSQLSLGFFQSIHIPLSPHNILPMIIFVPKDSHMEVSVNGGTPSFHPLMEFP